MSLFADNADQYKPDQTENLAHRIQYYYTHPAPGTLRNLFTESWDAGLFQFPNGKPNPITMTFFAAALDATGEAGWEGFIEDIIAEVTSHHPKQQGRLSRWLNKKPDPRDRLNALAIIAFLSRDPAQHPLRYFLKQTLPPEDDINVQLAEAETDLALMRPKKILDNPLQLDQLWAVFFATGDEEALRGIIAVANGDRVATPEELRGAYFDGEMIMQAAAVSLVELAPRQQRICQIMYNTLDNYQNTPAYAVLIMALERAGVAQLEQNADGSLDVKFQVPPDWL